MNPFDISQISQVSDAPEETPEDVMRQQMMQRLGAAMNPQAAAQAAAAQRLGQNGQGVKGWLERILGGAAEGLRFSQDPKYRGAYQEELTRAQEQEKNMLPYARQLEASSAQRYKARMDAQEKERATAAKVYDSLLKDSRAKFKNETDRFKADAFILESKAKSDKLRAEGKFTEAKTIDQQVETEYLRRFGPSKPTEAMQNAFVKAGGFGNVTPEQVETEQNALFNKNLLLKLAPGLMRPQSSGGARTTQREQLVKDVGLFGEVKPRKELLTTTSTPSINYSLSPEQESLKTSLLQRASSALQDPASAAQPVAQPSQPVTSPLLPQAKKKPTPTPPALGASSPPTQPSKSGPPPPAPPPDKAVLPKGPEEVLEVQKNLNRMNNMRFTTPAAAKQAMDFYNASNYAAELRATLGASMEEMAPYMGAIKGSGMARTIRSVADALGLMPADSAARKVRIENLFKKNETIDRVITTGKQMNTQEMKDIISYMPAQNQTYARAMTNALALDITFRMTLERMKRGDIDTPAIPGNLVKYAENIYSAYQEAYQEKGEARARKLKQIELFFRPEHIWSAATGQ